VRLTPSAASDAIDGIATDAASQARLKIRVRAAAENNQANRALEAFLGKRLKLAKSRVKVISGATSRTKTVRVEGDPQDLAAKLEGLA
jgi:uncharacterized protein YggU (UPF0235/DUF167 family)